MRIGKFLYFGDFVAIPVLMSGLSYLAFQDRGVATAAEFSALAIFGLLFWTLAEYGIHRFLYHHAPVLSPLHDAHHRAPNDLIGVPSFISSGLVVVLGYLPFRAFAPVGAAGFATGLLAGYAVYMFVHHATHHMKIRPGDWLYDARVRHMAHHYHEDTNFGVSTGVWDRVFGTTGRRRDRLART